MHLLTKLYGNAIQLLNQLLCQRTGSPYNFFADISKIERAVLTTWCCSSFIQLLVGRLVLEK